MIVRVQKPGAVKKLNRPAKPAEPVQLCRRCCRSRSVLEFAMVYASGAAGAAERDSICKRCGGTDKVPVPFVTRVCRRCGDPIASGHGYVWVTDGWEHFSLERCARGVR